jgi:PAS domain S-box-containing protein
MPRARSDLRDGPAEDGRQPEENEKLSLRIPGLDGKSILFRTGDAGHADATVEPDTEALDELFSCCNDIIYVIDYMSRYIYANSACCKLVGCDRADLIGRSWRDLGLPEDIMEPVDARIKMVFATGEPFRGEARFPAGGKARDIEYTMNPVRAAGGRVGQVLVIARDITGQKKAYESLVRDSDDLKRRFRERTQSLVEINRVLSREIIEHKLVEQELMESERKFRALAEMSPAALFVYQGEDIQYANPTAEQLTGYSRSELKQMKYWQLFAPEHREMVKTYMIARQHGEHVPTRYEVVYLTRDGRERWAEILAGLIEYGRKPAVLAKAFDITERKQAERALKKSQFILAKSQQMAHVGNWAWNVKTGQMQWSDEGFRIFGYLPQQMELSIDWLRSRVNPEDQGLFKEFVDRIRIEGRLGSIDIRITRPDGSVRYVNCVADKLVYDKPGEPAWVYGINQEVTERKQTEKALKEAKARAELYLDLMSHDINNLNQIGMGFLELALDTLELDEAGREMITRPLEAMKSSSTLISNVRKIQRIQAGNLERHRISLADMIRRLIPRYARTAERQIEITLTGDDCQVMANDLLEDVLANLIGNAVRHSEGPLTVGIGLALAQIDGRDFCRIAIEDDGPGIPDAVKAGLFQRQSGKPGGHGLGLYLVRSLVDDFGGRVRVEDRVPGDYRKGSRFVVELPAA